MFTSAARSKACPKGCDVRCSRLAASARQASASRPAKGFIWASCIIPVVSVPVLSKTTSVACASTSMACPRVTSRPSRASRPDAIVNATGVASDKAHGQLTTSTATVTGNAIAGSSCHQTNAVSADSASNPHRNHEATRSAVVTATGFSSAPRSINRRIAARRVAAPTCSTRTVKGLSRFIEPPVTMDPMALGTG